MSIRVLEYENVSLDCNFASSNKKKGYSCKFDTNGITFYEGSFLSEIYSISREEFNELGLAKNLKSDNLKLKLYKRDSDREVILIMTIPSQEPEKDFNDIRDYKSKAKKIKSDINTQYVFYSALFEQYPGYNELYKKFKHNRKFKRCLDYMVRQEFIDRFISVNSKQYENNEDLESYGVSQHVKIKPFLESSSSAFFIDKQIIMQLRKHPALLKAYNDSSKHDSVKFWKETVVNWGKERLNHDLLTFDKAEERKRYDTLTRSSIAKDIGRGYGHGIFDPRDSESNTPMYREVLVHSSFVLVNQSLIPCCFEKYSLTRQPYSANEDHTEDELVDLFLKPEEIHITNIKQGTDDVVNAQGEHDTDESKKYIEDLDFLTNSLEDFSHTYNYSHGFENILNNEGSEKFKNVIFKLNIDSNNRTVNYHADLSLENRKHEREDIVRSNRNRIYDMAREFMEYILYLGLFWMNISTRNDIASKFGTLSKKRQEIISKIVTDNLEINSEVRKIDIEIQDIDDKLNTVIPTLKQACPVEEYRKASELICQRKDLVQRRTRYPDTPLHNEMHEVDYLTTIHILDRFLVILNIYMKDYEIRRNLRGQSEYVRHIMEEYRCLSDKVFEHFG